MLAKSARECALTYMKYGDRTVCEMRRYLTKKGYEQGQISEALDFLKEYQFVDDEKYCRRYVEYAVEKRKSQHRIAFELQQKGIDNDLIKTCLAEGLSVEMAFENALAEAHDYIRKRGLGKAAKEKAEEAEAGFENTRWDNSKLEKAEMDKIMRRLAYLGYEQDIIYKVSKELR